MSGKVDILPFTNLVHLGDLVDILFPTTSVYNSSNNEPLVLEWADLEDENLFYLYQTTPLNLKLYLEKRLSHFELIQNAVMGISYLFKGDIHSPSDITIVPVKNLPSSYFPDSDVFFEAQEAYEVDVIENNFNLSSISGEESNGELMESFNLHFRQGKHIGFGEGDAKVIGDVLSNFSSLYEEVVTDKHKGVERNAKLNKIQRENFTMERVLNFSYALAASVSLIVKPKTHIERITFEDNIPSTTEADDTFSRISDLLKGSIEFSDLRAIKDNYNTKVFKKLEKLAESIRDNELSIDFRYRSIQTSQNYDVNFTVSNSNGVIANLKRIYEDDFVTEEHEGAFDMIHCGTGHFSFVSNSDKFRGYFVKGLTDLKGLDFQTQYGITITRTMKKGKQDEIKITAIDSLED